MTLPYETASSGDRALAEAQRVLARFGVQTFGAMTDYERECVVVQFRYGGRQIHMEASIKGYAEAYHRAHPYRRGRLRITEDQYRVRVLGIARHAVCSILRDWIKGQMTAIETGVFSFEAAFLGQIMLPSGVTIGQHAVAQKLLGGGS